MQQTICVGGLTGKKWGGTYEQTDRVYLLGDVFGTLVTGGNGSKCMFLESQKMDSVNLLGSLYGQGTSFAGAVYGSDGLSPTIRTCQGGNLQPDIVEVKKMGKTICAECGRDKENPNHRGHATENYEQRLEPNAEGIANTITTVTKDNLLVETDVKYVKVKQATSEGYIPCEIGGGCGPQLSVIKDKKRKGNRQRESESYADDNGCP